MLYALKKREPEWLTIVPASGKVPAVEIHVIPITRAMKAVARQELRHLLGEGVDKTELAVIQNAGDAFSKSLLRQGVDDWRGVGDGAGKRPLAFSPEAFEMFLADDLLFETADRLYVLPAVALDREKNASAGSPNGTGKAATPAKTTAASSAARTRKAAAANAPTSPTRPKPSRARKSGRS